MSLKCPYFCADLGYHVRSFDRQKSDATIAMLQRASISSASCVVDVGCGAGQTLRIVEELNPSVPLIGLDADESALEDGRALGERILFVRGQGERLPIAEGSASHIISRIAINYMHQARTMAEMIRTLSPDGRIIVSFIGFGYTLRNLLACRQGGWRQRCGNLKDLFAGLSLQFSGAQSRRGTFWGRSVPYSSPWRVRRQLRNLGCELAYFEVEDTFMGFPTAWWAIIHKTR
jgi:SAM-dependent methyltransferase